MVSATMGNGNKSCYPLGAVSIVVLILCTTVSLGQIVDTDLPELKLVVSLFRHAGRVPGHNDWESFPTDPHQKVTYKEGRGQLTNKGKLEAYNFGKVFRKQYDAFLGKSYIFQKVEARATAIVRSQLSLELVLAGIYPPSEEQTWNEELKWQPAYMTDVPFNKDALLLPGIAFNLFDEAFKKNVNTAEAQHEIEKFHPLFEHLKNMTGRPQNTPLHMLLLYQTFAAQTGAGLTLPSWANSIYPEGELKDALLLFYRLQNYNDDLKRLNGGVLLHKIIRDMRAKQNGTVSGSEKDVYLYCAQDVTLVGLLNVLNVYDNEPPAFCSGVNLELRASSDGKHYVKILRYLGDKHPEMKEVKIPGCTNLCPFEDFLELTSKYIPSEDELRNFPLRNVPYI